MGSGGKQQESEGAGSPPRWLFISGTVSSFLPFNTYIRPPRSSFRFPSLLVDTEAHTVSSVTAKSRSVCEHFDYIYKSNYIYKIL